MPAAVGMALARPDEKIIAVLGDGSSMYAIQGLRAAKQWNANIAFVILKNGRYEALHSFGRHFGMHEMVGTMFPDLDFVALAKGHGVSGVRAEDPTALDAALSHAFATNGPILVEAVIV
ncbi:thiamine pyrophosphate-dependent enzyme [Aquisediminimonas profunda]|uniref:thiamine pyrophosphate-dependent enzyme n=1 Tax=Aquisediminimonas profunda TaxID=1550733 RepID=UPI002484AF76|nr:thiamine pyrophosphate-dependent enzyme [Aquisediminimonas profunda]